MSKREKIYIFRENGKLYVAKESVYLQYIRLKKACIRCNGFNNAHDVIEFLCDGSVLSADDFIVVI